MIRLTYRIGLFLLAAYIALGQNTGSVSGTVTDDTGEAVAGGYVVASPFGQSPTHSTYTAITSARRPW